MWNSPSRLRTLLRVAAMNVASLVVFQNGYVNPSTAQESPKAEQASSASQQMVFEYWPAGLGQPQGPGSKYQVAITNINGGHLEQLTFDGAEKFLPHFSPDATKIVYTKFIKGGIGASDSQTEIAVYDISRKKEKILTSGGTNGYATWSPDGRRIAYLKNTRLGQAYTTTEPTVLMIIDADGSNPRRAGAAKGTPNDWLWGDIAWSKQNWILFVVGETVNGALCKARVDKIRPDGSSRTKVSDGGAGCTPPGVEAIGDADPDWSSDGKTIYSSRGFPTPPVGGAPLSTERRLYAFSSDAWYPGKPAHDLSLPLEPSCIEGVPKVSPDGKRILLFRACYDTGKVVRGLYITDTKGSYRTLVNEGFGPDWNPTINPAK